MSNIIDIKEFKKNLEDKINDIIKDSTYSQLSNYIEMLPHTYDTEKDLYFWGFSYINEYYKIIGKLDKVQCKKIELLRYKIYILYLKEKYGNITLSYEEFITFSKLLNTTFTGYNPNKNRDITSYKCEDKEIHNKVISIMDNVYHSSHPHAYEIPKFKVDILRNTLIKRKTSIMNKEFKLIDLESVELSNILSDDRIKKLKNK